jgi:hypothetical protein
MYSDTAQPTGLMQGGVRPGLDFSGLRYERPLHADLRSTSGEDRLATEATVRDRGQVYVI